MTFSVVFAYVADITQEHERSMAYGLVCTVITIYSCWTLIREVCSMCHRVRLQTDAMLIYKIELYLTSHLHIFFSVSISLVFHC